MIVKTMRNNVLLLILSCVFSSYASYTNISLNVKVNLSANNVSTTNSLFQLASLDADEQFTLEFKSEGSYEVDGDYSWSGSGMNQVGLVVAFLFYRQDIDSYLDIDQDGHYLSLYKDQGKTASISSIASGKIFPGPGEVWFRILLESQLASNPTIRFDRNYTYRIEKKASQESNNLNKFSVAMDDDGDRVVVGYKETGTNAVVRVYEFDGSSWNQLGENLD